MHLWSPETHSDVRCEPAPVDLRAPTRVYTQSPTTTHPHTQMHICANTSIIQFHFLPAPCIPVINHGPGVCSAIGHLSLSPSKRKAKTRGPRSVGLHALRRTFRQGRPARVLTSARFTPPEEAGERPDVGKARGPAGRRGRGVPSSCITPSRHRQRQEAENNGRKQTT